MLDLMEFGVRFLVGAFGSKFSFSTLATGSSIINRGKAGISSPPTGGAQILSQKIFPAPPFSSHPQPIKTSLGRFPIFEPLEALDITPKGA
jgi:hypothetical protein